MTDSVLTIGEVTYPLTLVELYAEPHEYDDAYFLELSIFADSEDLKCGGIAINSLSLKGLSDISQIQGTTITFERDDDDGYNDLSESVICEPGGTLELESLTLHFGDIDGDCIPVTLDATCFRLHPDTAEVTESAIPVHAAFTADIDDR